MTAKRKRSLDEEMADEFTQAFDRTTLATGIGKREAADMALEIAARFKERSECLTEEADAEDE